MKKFKEFKNELLIEELNEGLFLDALKGIWNFFKGASKEFQDSANNFTKKIEVQKGWDAVYKTTEAEITNLNQILTNKINSAQDINHIRKSLFDFHRNIFTELMIVSKKMAPNDPQGYLTPIKLFTGTPFWKMYNFDKTQKFVNNLPKAVDALVLDMANKSGFSKEEIQKSIKQYPNPNDVPETTEQTTVEQKPNEQKSGEQPTEQKPNEQTNTEQKTVNQKQTNDNIRGNSTESYILKYSEFNKLFEENNSSNAPNPTNSEVGGNTNQQTNQQQTNQQQTNTNQNANQNTDMTKIKQQVLNTTKTNFLGQIVQKKLKEFKAKVTNQQTTGANTEKDTENIAKSMKGSTNVETKKNILNFVKNADKNTLKKVRDLGGGKDKLGAL
jgi:hypothetical protein